MSGIIDKISSSNFVDWLRHYDTVKMRKRYSRRQITEDRTNVRKAILFSLLSVVLVTLFFFFGLPSIIKFTAFLTEIRSTSKPIDSFDNTPPPPPKLDTLPAFTNKEEIEVRGHTEPGVTAKLFINDKEFELITDNEGEFFHIFNLKDGSNKISALSIDRSGNESQKTDTFIVTLDKEPPELEITKPKDGTELYGSSERQVVIEGMTEDNASIVINGRIVVVEADGTFAFTTSLTEGDNSFNVKSEDKAGNTNETSFSVKFTP